MEKKEEFFDAVSSPPDSPSHKEAVPASEIPLEGGVKEEEVLNEEPPSAPVVHYDFEKAIELKTAGNNYFKEGKLSEV